MGVKNDDESKGLALLALFWARTTQANIPAATGLLGPWVTAAPPGTFQIGAATSVAADVRTAPLALLTPVSPADNHVFLVLDAYAMSAKNPISVTDLNGFTLWNPQNPGTFAASIALSDPSGAPVRFKLYKSHSVWLPW